MLSARMRNLPRFQYGLRTLFWLTTGFTVACSAVATCPSEFRPMIWEVVQRVFEMAPAIGGTFLVVVVAIEIVSWFKLPDPGADSLGRKVLLLLSLGRFWIAIGFTIPIAIALILSVLSHIRGLRW